MPRQDLMGFPRGLVTDAIGVDGALLELTDGWIDREGEVRKRGGRSTIRKPVLTGVTIIPCHGFHKGGVGGLIQLYNGTTYYIYRTGFNPADTLENLGRPINHTGSAPAGQDITSATSVLQYGTEALVTEVGSGVSFKVALPALDSVTDHDYTTAQTVSITANSAVVTASANAGWLTNVAPDQYLFINSATNDIDKVRYRIKSVDSNTQLTLYEAFPNDGSYTIAGSSYAITTLGRIAAPDSVFANNWMAGVGVAVHGARVFCGHTYDADGEEYPDRYRWSALPFEQSGVFKGCDYWQADAYDELFPGVGGSGIKGIHSFDRELMFVKSSGLFSVVGEFSSDGTNLGHQSRIISQNIGHISGRVGITQLGLIIGHQTGAHVYDGTTLYNLTQATNVQRAWDELYSVGGTSCWEVGNRIMFGTSDNGGPAMCYDLDTKTWSQITTGLSYDCGPVQYYAFTGYPSVQAIATTGVADGIIHDVAYDRLTTNKNDGDATSYPRLKMTTHPINLGDSPLSNGRPKEIYVNGFVTDAASDNPTLGVTLLQGRKGLNTGASSALSAGSVAEGTVDKTHRLPVSGAFDASTSAMRIRIVQANAASDARVYGIGCVYDVDRDVTSA